MLKSKGVMPLSVSCKKRAVIRPLIVGALSCYSVAAANVVYAVDLPDAASPGGVQRPIEPLPIEPTETQGFAIPPRIEREENDTGPTFTITKIKLLERFPDNVFKKIDDQVIQEMIAQVIETRDNVFNLGRLQALADQLTNYYREKGSILATVYLPAQDVVDESVELHLLQGVLEGVEIEGESKYSDSQLEKAFENQLDKVVNKESLESGLLTLLDYPGVNISGTLRPGDALGAAKIALEVQPGEKYSATVFTDNYGSRYTGENGIGGAVTINNLLGYADILTLNAAVQKKPSVEGEKKINHSLSGGLNYSFRPFDPSYIVSVGYSASRYEIGRELSELGFEGSTKNGSIKVRKQLKRSRTSNQYLEAGLELKSAKTLRDDKVQSHDRLTNIVLEAGFDHIDSFAGGGYNQGSVTVVSGLDNVLGSLSNADSDISRTGQSGPAPIDFKKLKFNFSRYQKINDELSVALKMQGQYSNDALVSVEQFGLGGINNVKAYSGAEFMADKAVYLGAELIARAPGFSQKPAFNDRTWGEVLQVSMFVDYAKGYKNDALENEDASATLKGVGVGLRLTPAKGVSFNLSVAKPLGGSAAAKNGRNPQIFARLQYSF